MPDGQVSVGSAGSGGVHGLSGEAVLRGPPSRNAVTVEKSAALSSVSVQPSSPRVAAVALSSVSVGPEPSKQFAWLP